MFLKNLSFDMPFIKLKHLKVDRFGKLPSLLKQVAPYITTLHLTRTMEHFSDVLVETPFKKLKLLVTMMENGYCDGVTTWRCSEIDICGSPLMSRGGTLTEFGSKIKSTWEEKEIKYY